MKIFKSKRKSENEEKKDVNSQTVDSNSNKDIQTGKITHTNETKNPTNLCSDEAKKEHLINKDEKTDKKVHEPVFSKNYFKKPIHKKLTIILIENTAKIATENDQLIKLIKNSISSGLVSIINYGSDVRKRQIFNSYNFNDINFLSSQNVEGKACLFDALVELEFLVSNSYMKLEEKENEDILIDNIEVIGIGTCTDNCSKVSKEVAIDCFCKVARKPGITTKYFCLTDETFTQAAEIGFHSIGAIFKNYQ